MSNIHEVTQQLNNRGAVISVRASLLGTQRQLSDAALTEDASKTGSVRAVGDLISKNRLKAVEKAAREARNVVIKRSIPFVPSVMSGAYWSSNENIPVIKQLFEKAEEKFNDEVQALVYNWNDIVAESKTRLGELAKDFVWPTASQVPSAFSVTLAIWQPQVAPFDSGMEDVLSDFKEQTTALLRSEFVGLISHLAERLAPDADGKAKVFKENSLNNIVFFLENMKSLNIGDDAELNRAMDTVRNMFNDYGIDASTLRYRHTLRSHVRNELNKIENNLAAAIVKEPELKRRLVMRRKPASSEE